MVCFTRVSGKGCWQFTEDIRWLRLEKMSGCKYTRALFWPRKCNNKRKVAGARTAWASSCEPVILVHVCVAARHAKGPSEGEYRSASVVIINYSLSQSHHCCHSSETVVPITVKRDDDGSTNRKLFFRKCLDSSERHDMNVNTHHHKSAAEDRWSSCFHQLVTMTMIEIQKYGFGEAVCMMLFQQ